MYCGLHVGGFEAYAEGTIQQPDDSVGASNWDYNDNYAQFIIVNNISVTEMVHIGQCKTAHGCGLAWNQSMNQRAIKL